MTINTIFLLAKKKKKMLIDVNVGLVTDGLLFDENISYILLRVLFIRYLIL